MTDDCDMVIRSCGDTIGYSTARVNTFESAMNKTAFEWTGNSPQIRMSIQRNGIRFYRGRLDFCEMLEYHQSDQFISIKINGDQAMCPVQPVNWFNLIEIALLPPNFEFFVPFLEIFIHWSTTVSRVKFVWTTLLVRDDTEEWFEWWLGDTRWNSKEHMTLLDQFFSSWAVDLSNSKNVLNFFSIGKVMLAIDRQHRLY